MENEKIEVLDKQAIIDYVFSRSRIQIDETDPIFSLIAINEITIGNTLKGQVSLIENYINGLIESSNALQTTVEHYAMKKSLSIFEDTEKLINSETQKALEKINDEAVKKISGIFDSKYSMSGGDSKLTIIVTVALCCIVSFIAGYFLNEFF